MMTDTQDFSRLRALTAAGKATGVELIDMNESDYAACQKGKQELATLCTPATVIALLDALDALQAEVKHLNLHLKATQSGRDAALARLAELEKQEPMTAPPGYKFVVVPEVEESEPDWDEVRRQSEVATGLRVEKNTYSIIIREVRRWIASTYASAGASPVEPKEVIKEIVVHADYREMWRQQLKMNQQLNAALSAQPPAPSDTAREHMTGYSDGREWAGATSQAQPSQALEPARIFTYKDQPCDNVTPWCISEAFDKAARGGDRIDHGLAILKELQDKGLGIAAIKAKERAAHGSKQGGQHD